MCQRQAQATAQEGKRVNGHVYIGPVAVIVISGIATLLSLGAIVLNWRTLRRLRK